MNTSAPPLTDAALVQKRPVPKKSGRPRRGGKIGVVNAERDLTIALKQITHIDGERNYSYIYLSNGSRELSSKNLAYFEDILSDKNFFRCHRSHLVNRYHVEALKDDHFVLKMDWKSQFPGEIQQRRTNGFLMQNKSDWQIKHRVLRSK